MTFGKSWFRGRKRLTEVWDSDRARNAHEQRAHYAVLLDYLPSQKCFVEIANGFVVVGFLDEKLREYMNYQFHEVQSGRLFLTMAIHRVFSGDSEQVISGTSN